MGWQDAAVLGILVYEKYTPVPVIGKALFSYNPMDYLPSLEGRRVRAIGQVRALFREIRRWRQMRCEGLNRAVKKVGF